VFQQADADADAVLEQFASGEPLDSSVTERVRNQAAQIVEQIRRSRGLVDEQTFQSLLDEET
jgi:hypothetical protein